MWPIFVALSAFQNYILSRLWPASKRHRRIARIVEVYASCLCVLSSWGELIDRLCPCT